MSAYSFLDVTGSITGPGGSIAVASGAGVAKEGITFDPTQEKNKMIIGADGEVMHCLCADSSGTLTVRALKTSKLNAQLQNMFNYQTTTATLHGVNHAVFNDTARGDVITCKDVAFKKQPPIKYSEEGDILEWTFDVGKGTVLLGVGTPEL